ncbi:MAG TPA: DUF3501 family protein [Thermoanaerobaculia bacterium]|nr:DUF3501 family protein [Thermoanaerobaculia bacterium]
MRAVRREEILDFVTYGEQRDEARRRILDMKRPRRIHVGDNLTFLFENHDTIRYQIQEMVLAEKIVKEAEIGHEIETYNEVGGGPGELGCALLIEIDDPAERQVKLQRWLDLPNHLYARLADGRRVPATYDERQVGDTRLSSVQYLKFATGGEVPVAIGADHPDLTAEAVLSEEQRAALEADLQ